MPKSDALPEYYPLSKGGPRPEYVAYLKGWLKEQGRDWSSDLLRSKVGYDMERQIYDGAIQQNLKRDIRTAVSIHRSMSNLPVREDEECWRDVVDVLSQKIKLRWPGICHDAADTTVTYEKFLLDWDDMADSWRDYIERGDWVLLQCPSAKRLQKAPRT